MSNQWQFEPELECTGKPVNPEKGCDVKQLGKFRVYPKHKSAVYLKEGETIEVECEGGYSSPNEDIKVTCLAKGVYYYWAHEDGKPILGPICESTDDEGCSIKGWSENLETNKKLGYKDFNLGFGG